jgi:hypothetical protein
MVSVSPERERKERASSTEAACGLRQSRVENVVDIQSPKFKSGEGLELAEVKSGVVVLPTAALAESRLAQAEAALGKPRVRACLKRAFEHELAKSLHKRPTRGVRILLGRTNISVLHPAFPHSFGFRIFVHLTFAARGLHIPASLYLDVLGFVVGPAGVGLESISFSRPVPTEQHLLSVLYSRATA